MIVKPGNDAYYLQWIRDNPTAYVVNCYRNPTPTYLILHTARCQMINGHPARGNTWVKDYIKVFSLSRAELESWAKEEIGGELHPCGICNP